jgi:hypothetical protein
MLKIVCNRLASHAVLSCRLLIIEAEGQENCWGDKSRNSPDMGLSTERGYGMANEANRPCTNATSCLVADQSPASGLEVAGNRAPE